MHRPALFHVKRPGKWDLLAVFERGVGPARCKEASSGSIDRSGMRLPSSSHGVDVHGNSNGALLEPQSVTALQSTGLIQCALQDDLTLSGAADAQGVGMLFSVSRETPNPGPSAHDMRPLACLSVLCLQQLHRLGPVIMRQRQPSELRSDCSEGIE